jgi:predicted helicase
MIAIDAEHIDGSMNAPQRDQLLSWLKSDTPQPECRMLTNVKCLSEGVDVPSLDAVLFLSARNSQVDVVQSVGRVMRNARAKSTAISLSPSWCPAMSNPRWRSTTTNATKWLWNRAQRLACPRRPL